MLNRLIPLLLIWSLRGSLAWFVMHEATVEITQRLDDVARALGGI